MYGAEYGDGRLGDVTISAGVFEGLNSYGRITNINKNVIAVENITIGKFADFVAGETVMLHVSATNGVTAERLGEFQLARIELVNGNLLTLDTIFDIDLNYYYVQVIAVPQFKNLSIENARIVPPPFDVFKFTGGILALQVFNQLTMQKSYIDLVSAGVPYQKGQTYRPLTAQELRGETDGAELSGGENLTPLVLNAGDGALFIQAHNFICDSTSRLGNPQTHGRALCRGAADSPFKPSNITNIGGSSLFIVADALHLQPENLAKYRSAELPQGRGLARCQIVSNSLLPADEKLYSFDIPADRGRVQFLGVEDFGRGNLGDCSNPNFQLNNYANVAAQRGSKLYLAENSLRGIATFDAGNLVLLRNPAGDIRLSRILERGYDFIKVAHVFDASEAIAVPEFSNLTLTNTLRNNGIWAVAVSGSINIHGSIFSDVKLACGNSQSWAKCGGIFILARNVNFAENARLSAALVIAEHLTGFSDAVLTGSPNFIYTARA